MDHKAIAISMAQQLRGLSYVLVMQIDQKWTNADVKHAYRNKDGTDLRFVPRENQPCWGELRKYERTHKGECTQPSNAKPGDLWHSFPDGKPFAFATVFRSMTGPYANDDNDTLMKFLLNEERSPWRKGLRQVSFIKDANDHIIGFYMDSLAVDPSIFVNFLRTAPRTSGAIFVKYLNAGFTEEEALALMYCNGNGYSFETYGIMEATYMPRSWSRFLQSNPRDISGGLMEDRVDYNRTLQDELWKPDQKVNIKGLATQLGLPTAHKTGVTNNIAEYKDRLKEFLAKVVVLEGVQKSEKFIWKTTSGNTNAPEVKVDELGNVSSTGRKVA